MRLRRVHLGSLLVVALALAGATVVPARDISRANAAIVWQAGDIRRTPVTAQVGSGRAAGAAARTTPFAQHTPHADSSPVRHALFQRPPPLAATRA